MADVKTGSISSTEFGKLFFEFKPRFIALAYRYVRDRETAEDLVSDSFMTFWEMHETLPADINVPAYILTSVKNRCLNHLNAQIRPAGLSGVRSDLFSKKLAFFTTYPLRVFVITI